MPEAAISVRANGVRKVCPSAAGQFWQQMCVRLQVCYFGNGNVVFQEFAEFLLGVEEYIHLAFPLFFSKRLLKGHYIAQTPRNVVPERPPPRAQFLCRRPGWK